MSTIKSSNYLNTGGTYGIKPNSDKGSSIIIDGVEIVEDAGCLYPLNKTKTIFNATGEISHGQCHLE